jgi:hypothetical protein
LPVAVPAADRAPQEASETQPATLEAVGKIARELIDLIPTGSPESGQDDAVAAATAALDIAPTAAAAVDLLARFEELGRRQGEQVAAWHEQLSGTARTGVYAAAAVGAIVGLIFGLLAPYIAASFQSALVGSMLMLFAGYGLVAQLAPSLAEHLPQTPRSILLALGLITVVGCSIQWCAFGKRADK